MPRARVLFVLASVGALLAVSASACGTDAVGVEACRTVENARCRRGAECGYDLANPKGPEGTSQVDACIRYYRDACLHGLASKNDPGPAGVEACASAIAAATTCDPVKTPELLTECAFLIPAPAADAGDAAVDAATADAADAAAESSTGADASDAATDAAASD